MNEQPKHYKPGDKYEIPVEGSLGLLAMGYKGLQMWREVREAAVKAQQESAKKPEGDGDEA